MGIPVFEHHLTVPDEAIDELNHVNNVAYIQWMQDAAIMHSDAVGATMDLYLRLGSIWVVKTHSIEYVYPALRGDEILIKTWVATKENRSSLRKFIFLRKDDGRVLARAETMWVYVDLRTGRSIPIPQEVGDRFTVVLLNEEPV